MEFTGTPAEPLTTAAIRGSGMEKTSVTTLRLTAAPGKYLLSLVLRYTLHYHVPDTLEAWVPGLFNNSDIVLDYLNSELSGPGTLAVNGVISLLRSTDVLMRSTRYADIADFLGGMIQFAPYYNMLTMSMVSEDFEKPWGRGSGTTGSEIFGGMTWTHIDTYDTFPSSNIAHKDSNFSILYLSRDGYYMYVLHLVGVGIGGSATIHVYDGDGLGTIVSDNQEIVADGTTSLMTWGWLKVSGIEGDRTQSWGDYPNFGFGSISWSSMSGRSIQLMYAPGWHGT